MRALGALLRRDLQIAIRNGGGFTLGMMFFLALVMLYPFALGPDLALLARTGPGILWLGALLSTLLSLDRLFTAETEDGSLDLLRLGDTPLALTCLTRALAHWLTSALPLVALTPVLGLLLNLDLMTSLGIALTLLVGTPALTLIGMMASALTCGLKRGSLLLPVLAIPLSVPTLIFGISAAAALTTGLLPVLPPLTILCAISLLMLVLAPLTAALALTAGLE